MNDQSSIQETLGDLKKFAPAGYALAFQIEYTTPTFLFQTYPSDWIRQYSEKGLVMADPTVHWGFQNEGTIRWSDLIEADASSVLAQAKSHGLNFGLTCSVSVQTARSFASFSRSDREFTDEEAVTLLAHIQDLHDKTAKIKTLSPETTLALQQMSVKVTPTVG